jgi:hypothetical protein
MHGHAVHLWTRRCRVPTAAVGYGELVSREPGAGNGEVGLLRRLRLGLLLSSRALGWGVGSLRFALFRFGCALPVRSMPHSYSYSYSSFPVPGSRLTSCVPHSYSYSSFPVPGSRLTSSLRPHITRRDTTSIRKSLAVPLPPKRGKGKGMGANTSQYVVVSRLAGGAETRRPANPY